MHILKFALIAPFFLATHVMAEECPAPEKIVEGLKKGHAEMKKAVATPTGIDLKHVTFPLGLPAGTDLTKLSPSEKPDPSSSERKICLYFAEGLKEPIAVIGVKK